MLRELAVAALERAHPALSRFLISPLLPAVLPLPADLFGLCARSAARPWPAERAVSRGRGASCAATPSPGSADRRASIPFRPPRRDHDERKPQSHPRRRAVGRRAVRLGIFRRRAADGEASAPQQALLAHVSEPQAKPRATAPPQRRVGAGSLCARRCAEARRRARRDRHAVARRLAAC